MWWIILLIPAAIVIAIFIYLRIAGHGSFPWFQFYTKGKESGFSFREVGLLRKIAIETQLENPTALFWSIKQLNRSIKEMIIKLRSQDMADDEEANHLLAKLYELRKKVEFELPRYRLGLKTSRDITQRMRLLFKPFGGLWLYRDFTAALCSVASPPLFVNLKTPQQPPIEDAVVVKRQCVATSV